MTVKHNLNKCPFRFSSFEPPLVTLRFHSSWDTRVAQFRRKNRGWATRGGERKHRGRYRGLSAGGIRAMGTDCAFTCRKSYDWCRTIQCCRRIICTRTHCMHWPATTAWMHAAITRCVNRRSSSGPVRRALNAFTARVAGKDTARARHRTGEIWFI